MKGKVVSVEIFKKLQQRLKLVEDIVERLPILQVQKLGGKGILPPAKGGDVGYDLVTSKDMVVPARNVEAVDVPTGVKVKIPVGLWGLVIGRSGALRKSGLGIEAGIIDNGYTGELYACCYNRTGKDIKVRAGTRLVQLILLPVFTPSIEFVGLLPHTERGSGGFGSTGIRRTGMDGDLPFFAREGQ